MKHFAIVLIYIAFFSLILGAVYITESAGPLWALLLTPSYNDRIDGPSEQVKKIAKKEN